MATAVANAAGAAANQAVNAEATLAAEVDPLATATVVANDVATTAQAAATIAQAAPAVLDSAGTATTKVSKASVGLLSGVTSVWSRIFTRLGGTGILALGVVFIFFAIVAIAAAKKKGGKTYGWLTLVLGLGLAGGGGYLFARRNKKASSD